MMKIDDFKADDIDTLEEKQRRMRRLLKSVDQEMLLMLIKVRLLLIINLSMKKT